MRRALPAGEPASRTAVRELVLSPLRLHTNRLHQPAALLRPVARFNINMLAPKTSGAVVRVAVALYPRAAVRAHKILNGSCKAHGT